MLIYGLFQFRNKKIYYGIMWIKLGCNSSIVENDFKFYKDVML